MNLKFFITDYNHVLPDYNRLLFFVNFDAFENIHTEPNLICRLKYTIGNVSCLTDKYVKIKEFCKTNLSENHYLISIHCDKLDRSQYRLDGVEFIELNSKTCYLISKKLTKYHNPYDTSEKICSVVTIENDKDRNSNDDSIQTDLLESENEILIDILEKYLKNTQSSIDLKNSQIVKVEENVINSKATFVNSDQKYMDLIRNGDKPFTPLWVNYDHWKVFNSAEYGKFDIKSSMHYQGLYDLANILISAPLMLYDSILNNGITITNETKIKNIFDGNNIKTFQTPISLEKMLWDNPNLRNVMSELVTNHVLQYLLNNVVNSYARNVTINAYLCDQNSDMLVSIVNMENVFKDYLLNPLYYNAFEKNFGFTNIFSNLLYGSFIKYDTIILGFRRNITSRIIKLDANDKPIDDINSHCDNNDDIESLRFIALLLSHYDECMKNEERFDKNNFIEVLSPAMEFALNNITCYIYLDNNFNIYVKHPFLINCNFIHIKSKKISFVEMYRKLEEFKGAVHKFEPSTISQIFNLR